MLQVSLRGTTTDQQIQLAAHVACEHELWLRVRAQLVEDIQRLKHEELVRGSRSGPARAPHGDATIGDAATALTRCDTGTPTPSNATTDAATPAPEATPTAVGVQPRRSQAEQARAVCLTHVLHALGVGGVGGVAAADAATPTQTPLRVRDMVSVARAPTVGALRRLRSQLHDAVDAQSGRGSDSHERGNGPCATCGRGKTTADRGGVGHTLAVDGTSDPGGDAVPQIVTTDTDAVPSSGLPPPQMPSPGSGVPPKRTADELLSSRSFTKIAADTLLRKTPDTAPASTAALEDTSSATPTAAPHRKHQLPPGGVTPPGKKSRIVSPADPTPRGPTERELLRRWVATYFPDAAPDAGLIRQAPLSVGTAASSSVAGARVGSRSGASPHCATGSPRPSGKRSPHGRMPGAATPASAVVDGGPSRSSNNGQRVVAGSNSRSPLLTAQASHATQRLNQQQQQRSRGLLQPASGHGRIYAQAHTHSHTLISLLSPLLTPLSRSVCMSLSLTRPWLCVCVYVL